MSASFSVIINEILTGGLSTVLNVLKILIPLMIFIEFLNAFNIMEKLSKKLTYVTRPLGLSTRAVLPLLVATIMGITYGTGTLMDMNKKNPLGEKDFVLIAVFFFICHGIIETTAIWGNAGANIIVVSIGRLFIAFAFTMIIARLWKFRPSLNEENDLGNEVD